MGRFGVRTVPAASRVRIGRWAGLEAVGCIERFLSGIGVEAARDPDARLDVGLQVGQDLFRLGFCQQLKVDGRAQLAKRLHWDGVGDHKGFVFYVVLLFTA